MDRVFEVAQATRALREKSHSLGNRKCRRNSSPPDEQCNVMSYSFTGHFCSIMNFHFSYQAELLNMGVVKHGFSS